MAGSTMEPVALDALRRLFYLDGDRVSLARHLAETRELATRDAALEALVTAARAAGDSLTKVRSSRRELEALQQDLQSRLLRSEKRLNSGQLSTQREISAVEAEVVQLRAAVEDCEERLLGVLVGEEQQVEALRLAESARAAEEPRAASRRAMAAGEAVDLEVRLKQIDAERREAAQRLPPDVVERYRALFPRTGGRPFAMATAGECDNCRHMLPASAVQAIRMHTGVPNCPSCGRLLIEAP